MSTSGRDVMTQMPALLITTDLGETPEARVVASYFARMDSLWAFAAEVAVLKGEGGYSTLIRSVYEERWRHANRPKSRHHAIGRDVVADRVGRLRVERVRLESPLETVLTAVPNDLSPLAYVIGGMFVLERAVKLLMNWQRHRAELEQMTKDDPQGHIVRALEEGMSTRPLPDSHVVALGDVEYLLRLAPIVRVERIDAPSASSDD